MLTVDPRLFAGIAAFLATGLLFLLYAYRRRTYILLWCVGWALVGTAMVIAARPQVYQGVGAFALGVSQFLTVLAGMAFIASVEAYRGALRIQRAHTLSLVPVFLWFAVAPLLGGSATVFVPGHLLAGAAMIAAGWSHLWLIRRVWLPGAGASGFMLALIGAGHFYMVFVVGDPGSEAAGRLLLLMAGASLLTGLCMQLMIFEDMTLELRHANHRLEAAQAELRDLAVTDPLTRCRNRRFFDEIIAKELKRHSRYNIPLSLLFADIDRFKAINDELGHDTGDRVLQEVAAFLMRNVREADYVFRWGGDEFLVLLSCQVREARRRARALQDAFAAAPGLASLPPGVGLSIGCVEVPPGTVDVTEFVARADELMYAEKRALADTLPAERKATASAVRGRQS